MGRIKIACPVASLAASGCGEAPPEAIGTPPADPTQHAVAASPLHCGGEAAPGAIDAYFRRLKDHLATSDDAVPMEFYAEQFGVVADGRQLSFRRDDMGAGARALPSRDDWLEISRRSPHDLESVGYRGCMLANGKVWFETDGDSVGLISFNKEMAWASDRP